MRLRMASGVLATLGLAAVSLWSAAPAQAQGATGCEPMQKLLLERKSMVERIAASQKSKKKMTPQDACSIFGRLVNNGEATLKFAGANKDWCQIPDSFIESMTADNKKIVAVRGTACNAVKQQAAMQKRAQQQAQGANPFGGADSVTSGAGGGMRIPQGAL